MLRLVRNPNLSELKTLLIHYSSSNSNIFYINKVESPSIKKFNKKALFLQQTSSFAVHCFSFFEKKIWFMAFFLKIFFFNWPRGSFWTDFFWYKYSGLRKRTSLRADFLHLGLTCLFVWIRSARFWTAIFLNFLDEFHWNFPDSEVHLSEISPKEPNWFSLNCFQWKSAKLHTGLWTQWKAKTEILRKFTKNEKKEIWTDLLNNRVQMWEVLQRFALDFTELKNFAILSGF